MSTAAQACPVDEAPLLRPAFSCIFEHISLLAPQSYISEVLYLSLILFTLSSGKETAVA